MNSYPNFENGSVLKKHMLEALRDYPRNILDNLLEEYSDGIISGFKIHVIENDIHISKGIIKDNGKLLSLDEEIVIEAINGTNYVYLEINSTEISNCIDTEILVNQYNHEIENAFELFRYTKNAQLKAEYKNFSEISSLIRNRIDIRRTKYSGIENRSIISPEILKLFACELLTKSNLTALDYAFSMAVINGANSSLLIQKYIECSLNKNCNYDDNLSIIESLNSILMSKQKNDECVDIDLDTNKSDKKIIVV